MKRGFSASTFILVALLLSVLYGVGKYVNPPTKGGHDDHDEEKPAPTQATAQAKPMTPPGKPSAPTQAAANGKQPIPSKPGEPKMNAGAPTSGGAMGDPKMAGIPRKPPGAHPPAPKSDGMDASYWQEHNMGAVTVKPDAAAH